MLEPSSGRAKISAVYRVKQPIENLKIRVRIVQQKSLLAELFENEGETRDSNFLEAEEREFSWQEKVLGPREARRYRDEGNCATDQQKAYHRRLLESPAAGSRLYSYVEADAHCPQAGPLAGCAFRSRLALRNERAAAPAPANRKPFAKRHNKSVVDERPSDGRVRATHYLYKVGRRRRRPAAPRPPALTGLCARAGAAGDAHRRGPVAEGREQRGLGGAALPPQLRPAAQDPAPQPGLQRARLLQRGRRGHELRLLDRARVAEAERARAAAPARRRRQGGASAARSQGCPNVSRDERTAAARSATIPQPGHPIGQGLRPRRRALRQLLPGPARALDLGRATGRAHAALPGARRRRSLRLLQRGRSGPGPGRRRGFRPLAKPAVLRRLDRQLDEVQARGLRLAGAADGPGQLWLRAGDLATGGRPVGLAAALLHGGRLRARRHLLLRGAGDAARGRQPGQAAAARAAQRQSAAERPHRAPEPAPGRLSPAASPPPRRRPRRTECGRPAARRRRRAGPLQGGQGAHDPGARHVPLVSYARGWGSGGRGSGAGAGADKVHLLLASLTELILFYFNKNNNLHRIVAAAAAGAALNSS
ncbi:serine/arginine repetitive matrix protein 1-like isoform X1 [Phymastichus coffea]|uniref:serine/arginine repetitive matrix protein 1-like isoform X1 n=1 Tax=Phymastichus coffea TaxID=108790 RepID=UPI00273CD852|nr:serine/arginine repetitive matrix protein 1-like isoform X1 [Phymastichus coffea]